jgi:hypothetical protein
MALPNALRQLFTRLSRAFQPAGLSVFDMVLESYCTIAMAYSARLGIADFLLSGARTIEEIAQHTACQTNALYRVMRTLASRGIYQELPGKCFCNTALSRPLAEGPGSMKHMVISHLGPTILGTFAHIDHSLKSTQAAATKYLGKDLFGYLDETPDEHFHFSRAMDDASSLSVAALLSAFNFRPFSTIVDVGGGLGRVLEAILSTSPQSKGWLFDRPETIKQAKIALESSPVAGRIQTQGGDFFIDPLPSGQLYVLKNILHDWDDQKAIAILDNVRRHAEPGATIVLVEAVLPTGNNMDRGKIFDLLMLLGLDGAKERTKDEYYKLLTESGFKPVAIKKTVAPVSVIIAKV